MRVHVGIDVSKAVLDVYVHPSQLTRGFANARQG